MMDDLKVFGTPYFKNLFVKKKVVREIEYSHQRIPIGKIGNGRLYYIDLREATRISMIGSSGCVDAETEFLTPRGWKRIDQYVHGDKVMSASVELGPIDEFNEVIDGNFVEPLNYIKLPETKMYYFSTKYGVDQCLSGEHKVLYCSGTHTKNKRSYIWKVDTMRNIYDSHQEKKYGFRHRFPSSFEKQRRIKRMFSDDEIRLITACIADGSIPYRVEDSKRYHQNMVFNIKKENKVKRLLKLLDNLEIKYSCNKMNNKYYRIAFYWDKATKEYDDSWYDLSYDELFIFAEESLMWDGSIDKKGRRRFSTTLKKHADFIQYCFTATGRRATINIKDRRGRKRIITGKEYITKSIDYNVCITDVKLISFGNQSNEKNKSDIQIIQPSDGFKYCFEVPSGFLVLRRNNKIFITGNSGKTWLMRGMIDRLKLVEHAPVFLSDIKGEMVSSLKPLQPKFHRLLLSGERPRALPIVELRPTFFKSISKSLPKDNQWYSVNMRRMTAREFMTFMNAKGMTPTQRTLMEIIYQEMDKRYKKDPKAKFSLEFIEQVIDSISEIDVRSNTAMKLKFRPLKESNFYYAEFEKSIVSGIKKGYVPAINLTDFESYGRDNFDYPTVTMSIILREIIRGRRDKDLAPLWIFIDEATRFCGNDKDNSFKHEVLEATDVERRFGTSFVFCWQSMGDIPQKILFQSRYIFVPGTENVQTIKDLLNNTGAARSPQAAPSMATRLKQRTKGRPYAWIVFDRKLQTMEVIDPLAPLSCHMEGSM